MTVQSLNRRPRLATVLQITLLLAAFQGVVATTPTVPTDAERPGALRDAVVPRAQTQP